MHIITLHNEYLGTPEVMHHQNSTSALHPSGLIRLTVEKISREAAGNRAGRGGRVSPALVSYMYKTDNSEDAVVKSLRQAKLRHRDMWRRNHSRKGFTPSLELGPPLARHRLRPSSSSRPGLLFGGTWDRTCPSPEEARIWQSSIVVYIRSHSAEAVNALVRECFELEPRPGDVFGGPWVPSFPSQEEAATWQNSLHE